MSAPQTIAQALDSLPEEERIILSLHYLRGLSAEEIAQMLKVPERSVTAIITSGKARLSALIGLK